MSGLSSEIIKHLYDGPKYTIDDIFNLFKKDDEQKIKRAIKDLKQQEFIKQKQDYDGSVIISLSEKGRLRALNLAFRRFENKREIWDGKWRMVSFDIPNSSVKGRKALAYRLKTGGFYKLQESLFLYPYDCKKEINALVHFFKIEKYVRFGIIESIDNQDSMIHHFKL